jgi:hypothetical protein
MPERKTMARVPHEASADDTPAMLNMAAKVQTAMAFDNDMGGNYEPSREKVRPYNELNLDT